MAAVELAWLACDLLTGAVAEELPSLHPTQALSRHLGAVTALTADLYLGGAPREWESATDPGRTMVVAVDTATGDPLWCGLTLGRDGGSGTQVRLSAATPEAWLDRRYTGTYSATATDQAAIMAAVATPALASGPPIVMATTPTGISSDYSIADGDDRTILSVLQEISGLSGGPEWTIEPRWADAAHTRVELVLRIQAAIGVQSPQPDAVFELPGCVSEYALSESYERGRGATSVTARGDRADGVRATSATHTDTGLLAAGWGLWEYRWTPAQGITATDQLESHAAEALALMGTGSRAWSLNAVASRSPRLGSAWGLGDSVRLAVASSPRHPAGVDVVARAYAWTLDPAADRVAPILLEDA
ncbi:hypothetical protein P3T27_006489 [Kitasatospora sp. MAA19]|uniref:hypothetical protein n=1 Tax=Kitasatospora sp. MAA19 TaxID=3035090 RepID=UPI002474DC2C|nr:hypothetical protein [Kitasatospora sp. MAA19]MDH6709740.1 hypothetical protein [Kitasatospora sp. MAA19]